MVGFAESLPRLRRRLARTLRDGEEPSRERVLALAVRLLDIGMFRVGSEQYAEEDSGIGLATIRKEHVRIEDDAVAFDYPGKGGARRRQVVEDPMSIELIRTLKRRRGGPPELLAYRDGRMARRALGRHQRLPKGTPRRGRQREGLPDLECDRDGGRDARGRRTRGGDRRPLASARSTRRSGPSRSCSATRRRWRDARTSTRVCSTATCPGGRSRERSSGSPRSMPPTIVCEPGSSAAVVELLDENTGLLRARACRYRRVSGRARRCRRWRESGAGDLREEAAAPRRRPPPPEPSRWRLSHVCSLRVGPCRRRCREPPRRGRRRPARTGSRRRRRRTADRSAGRPPPSWPDNARPARARPCCR